MSQRYELEKWIWTEADFEQMGWHDARVYAVSFVPDAFEIVLDIDYILEWVHPAAGETYFKFWVAPATLVFEGIYEIEMELSEPDFELDYIERKDPRRPPNAHHLSQDTDWLWSLEAHRGVISFRSAGYKQYFRQEPVFGNTQSVPLEVRGGISFSRGQRNA